MFAAVIVSGAVSCDVCIPTASTFHLLDKLWLTHVSCWQGMQPAHSRLTVPVQTVSRHYSLLLTSAWLVPN